MKTQKGKKKLLEYKIIDIHKNNFLIEIESDLFLGSTADSDSLHFSSATFVLNFIKSHKRVYYYFDKKYVEQYLLNPEMTTDILIAKYPDNTINKLIEGLI